MSPVKAPRPKPSDVGSPVPQSAAMAPSPGEQLILDQALAQLGERQPDMLVSAPANTHAESENIPPGEQLLLDQALAQMGEGATPTPGPAPAPVSAEGAPFPPVTEMSAVGRMKVKFGKTPENQQQIAQTVLGPNYETAIQDNEIMFRARGTQEWHAVDPKMFSSATEFVKDILDFAPEVLETGASSLGTALGAMAGLLGGPGGSFAGAAAGGAAGGAFAAGVREAASRMMGAEASKNLTSDLSWAAGFGALGNTVANYVFRKPIQAATHAIKESVLETSEVARTAKLSTVQQELNNIYSYFAGKSHRTLGEAGSRAATEVITRKDTLGELVGTVWKTAIAKDPTKKLVPQNMVQHVQKELGEYFHAVPVPPTKPGGRVIMELKPFREVPDDVKGYYTRMKELYGQLVNSDGLTFQQYRDTLGKVKSWANFDNHNPGLAENSWRTLDKVFSAERDDILEQAVKGSDIEGLVSKQFSDYRKNIDAVRELASAAEKSPEKFAAHLLSDAKTAALARDTLKQTISGEGAWEAIVSTWFKKHADKFTDQRTGIVKISSLVKSLNKNPDMVETVLGKEYFKQLEGLATKMDKITWQGLLANPDTVSSNGMFRALGRFAMAPKNPNYGANLLGALTSYEPRVLKLVQEKGILQFAKESKTLQEKNHWLRAANMLDRMIEGLTVKVNGKPVALEGALLTTFLRAGTPHPEDSPEDIQRRQANAKEAMEEFLARQPTSQEKARSLSERNAR